MNSSSKPSSSGCAITETNSSKTSSKVFSMLYCNTKWSLNTCFTAEMTNSRWVAGLWTFVTQDVQDSHRQLGELAVLDELTKVLQGQISGLRNEVDHIEQSLNNGVLELEPTFVVENLNEESQHGLMSLMNLEITLINLSMFSEEPVFNKVVMAYVAIPLFGSVMRDSNSELRDMTLSGDFKAILFKILTAANLETVLEEPIKNFSLCKAALNCSSVTGSATITLMASKLMLWCLSVNQSCSSGKKAEIKLWSFTKISFT
ncbi:hypothetical protein WICPIJ_003619 [Wickerhamomyces pijperi]|uniref:Uncharacterized protein n=1 Tax=Wickerhamomyces pijperi TaxID=599730 RepID=A0A9P8TNQ2_WICPI|nr:hypothetical protein WICPIJ_003619 [Wickerhamomyces pijperi]